MFLNGLWCNGWLVTDTIVSFPDYGDSVLGSTYLLLCMHTNSKTDCKPVELRSLLPAPSQPIACYIWAPFNTPEHAVSYGDGDPSFNLHAVNDTGLPPMKACPPYDAQGSLVPSGVRISYNLHHKHDNPSILPGASIVNVDGVCPEFDAHENTNLFGHHFGIEFIYNGHIYVQAVLPFEFVSCVCLTNNLTYKLSHTSNIFCMDDAIPAITSSCIFKMIYDQCIQICCSNFEIYQPHWIAAPATHVQLFLNGAVGARLP
jgi:hypothetical protein